MLRRIIAILLTLVVLYAGIVALTLPNQEQRTKAVETVKVAYELAKQGDFDTMRLSEDIGSFVKPLEARVKTSPIKAAAVIGHGPTYRPVGNYSVTLEVTDESGTTKDQVIVQAARTKELGRDFVSFKKLLSRFE